jgi:hypothetical protein
LALEKDSVANAAMSSEVVIISVTLAIIVAGYV